ncbi:response regulator, partial [uncultured Abyssibacter sp.]|uniref:response regulator n=1 Tax=uncultured Abyssibacter sp. TaxID=2320202 RepID=UPI0032B107A2
ALRALEHGDGLLIIGLSASVSPELRKQWLQAGADSVLEKGADDRVLLRHLLRLAEPAESGDTPPLTDDPELRDMLRAELPLQVQQIRDAWQQRDIRQAYDATHQLHGTAAFYKLHALRDVCRRLEQRLGKDETDVAWSELEPLRETLFAQVDAYLDKLSD